MTMRPPGGDELDGRLPSPAALPVASMTTGMPSPSVSSQHLAEQPVAGGKRLAPSSAAVSSRAAATGR